MQQRRLVEQRKVEQFLTHRVCSPRLCALCATNSLCVFPLPWVSTGCSGPTHPYDSMVPGDSPALKSAYADCCSPLLLGAEHLHSLL